MSLKRINVIRAQQELDGARPAAAVPEPIGDPVSLVRSTSNPGVTSRHGAWECSPGTWRRQVLQAEFCHFLEGEAIFTADTGESVHLQAGDSAYFPARSTGVWHVLKTSRKVFIVFDEPEVA